MFGEITPEAMRVIWEHCGNKLFGFQISRELVPNALGPTAMGRGCGKNSVSCLCSLLTKMSAHVSNLIHNSVPQSWKICINDFINCSESNSKPDAWWRGINRGDYNGAWALSEPSSFGYGLFSETARNVVMVMVPSKDSRDNVKWDQSRDYCGLW